MEDLRIRYNELESELAKRFSDILSSKEEIILYNSPIADLCEDDGETPDDYFERRIYETGEVIEIFIIKVSADGISTVDYRDNNKQNVIRFSDLCSIEDRLNLLGLMENKL